MDSTENLREEAKASLSRIQEFDAQDLSQSSRLGASNFEDAVEPARDIISLFKQLPVPSLDYFPDKELNVVKSQSNSVFQNFSNILEFDVNEGDVRNRQTRQVEALKNSYQGIFTQLFPLISFSISRTVDFAQLEQQGRSSVQEIKDQTDELMTVIRGQQEEADRILDEVRKTAAEQGISQEAYHFEQEANNHGEIAISWKRATIVMASILAIYGVATLFFHKIPFLAPQNTYETVQFTVGKILVFFVISYMLALCSKSFLSNRHNEIVNRHRQNALLTYKSLVDAGGTPEARDVILNHAAASVYKLHDTGFAKPGETSGSSSSSIVEMLPRTSLPLNASGS